jgi:DNA polymerase phi
VLIESEAFLRLGAREAISVAIDHLVSLACKKAWLREPAAKALCSLLATLPRVQNGNQVAEEILRKVEEGGLMATQDGAAILLALEDLPTPYKANSKIWVHGDPTHAENLKQFAKVLKEVSSEEDTVKSSGNFKGEPHFIWTLILRRRWDEPKDFGRLWKTVVDGMKLF